MVRNPVDSRESRETFLADADGLGMPPWKSQSLPVNTSGFISPEGDKAVLVLINNGEEEMRYRLEPSHYIVENAIVYQSVFGKTCTSEDGLYQNLGDIGPEGTLVLPAGSVTTVDITGKRQ